MLSVGPAKGTRHTPPSVAPPIVGVGRLLRGLRVSAPPYPDWVLVSTETRPPDRWEGPAAVTGVLTDPGRSGRVETPETPLSKSGPL